MSIVDVCFTKVKALFFLIINYLIKMIYHPDKSENLAIFRLDGIGDFIIWLEYAKEFKKIYPDKRITLYTSCSVAELALEIPYWDEVQAIDTKLFKRNLIYRWKKLSQVRVAGYEIAIQPAFSRGFLVDECLMHITGAKHRIAWRGDCSNITTSVKRITDSWYTELIETNFIPISEIERNDFFIRHFSPEFQQINQLNLSISLSLPKHLIISENYFVIFPGASWSGKQWPAEKFALLAKKLVQKYNWKVVIAGSELDSLQCNKVAVLLDNTAIKLYGQTNLLELSGLIKKSKLLISNDTSAIHFAAAVATPSVCILGGGHFGRFLPYPSYIKFSPIVVYSEMLCFGCNWNCNQNYTEGLTVSCIREITVNNVYDVIQNINLH